MWQALAGMLRSNTEASKSRQYASMIIYALPHFFDVDLEVAAVRGENTISARPASAWILVLCVKSLTFWWFILFQCSYLSSENHMAHLLLSPFQWQGQRLGDFLLRVSCTVSLSCKWIQELLSTQSININTFIYWTVCLIRRFKKKHMCMCLVICQDRVLDYSIYLKDSKGAQAWFWIPLNKTWRNVTMLGKWDQVAGPEKWRIAISSLPAEEQATALKTLKLSFLCPLPSRRAWRIQFISHSHLLTLVRYSVAQSPYSQAWHLHLSMPCISGLRLRHVRILGQLSGDIVREAKRTHGGRKSHSLTPPLRVLRRTWTLADTW